MKSKKGIPCCTTTAVNSSGAYNYNSDDSVPAAIIFDDSLTKVQVEKINAKAYVGTSHGTNTLNGEHAACPSNIDLELNLHGDEMSHNTPCTSLPRMRHDQQTATSENNQGGIAQRVGAATPLETIKDIEEGGLHSTDEILADAVLVTQPKIIEVEPLPKPEQFFNQHVVVNQFTAKPEPAPITNQKLYRRHSWCFVISVILIVLITTTSMIAGVVIFLQRKNNAKDQNKASFLSKNNNSVSRKYDT